MLIFADGALLQAHDIGIGIQNILDHRVRIVRVLCFFINPVFMVLYESMLIFAG